MCPYVKGPGKAVNRPCAGIDLLATTNAYESSHANENLCSVAAKKSAKPAPGTETEDAALLVPLQLPMHM